MNSSKTFYEKHIHDRSKKRYLLGLLVRYKKHLYLSYIRYKARKNGANIGENSVFPLSLAKKANSNLTIGDNSSIQTDLFGLLAPITIGNNVIRGSGVEILTCSHNIDSPDWEFKAYGIEISDYVWIATRIFVLPSCTKIGEGAVCGGGSLVVKNVEEMSVVSGSPAEHIKYRKHIHSNLVVESLLGGDYRTYKKTWANKK
jgi:acetyltransferase-like isoleucine patch superfamily enzyme